VSEATRLIELAFDRLRQLPGYRDRVDQRQLAQLIGDCIDGGVSGAFEAPTGLGKSLAALIPAFAYAIAENKRTVIATYTNVLAEQYWTKDVPLALSLFDEPHPKPQFFIGRQRYVCLDALGQIDPDLAVGFEGVADQGIESEFRRRVPRRPMELGKLWSQVATPPVCAGRHCHLFDRCFYYRARRAAERAPVVITNHAMVLQDAQDKAATEGALARLGTYHMLILDEAHDFGGAAQNALEFELSEPKVAGVQRMVARLEAQLADVAREVREAVAWTDQCARFIDQLETGKTALRTFGERSGRPGLLMTSPSSIGDHPGLKATRIEALAEAQTVSDRIAELCLQFTSQVERRMTTWAERPEGAPKSLEEARDIARSYLGYVQNLGIGSYTVFDPPEVSVSHVGVRPGEVMLRRDTIDLAGPLKELIWSKVPVVSMSATLALDGDFSFYRRTVGADPTFEEILPSPFDYATQSALYLPPRGRVPDPTAARRDGYEPEYFSAIARELSNVIRGMNGRTLALFHSRREMEAVYSLLDVPDCLPILLQKGSTPAQIGERFRKDPQSSLLALRSFWTGFDAPGETLSCVVLVRVPFEVPVEPPAMARQAWLAGQGMDPFSSWTLPMAKMMVRQGVGRLIRRDEDRGLIVLLDPRLRTKRYGDDILANLPADLRTYDDLDDAIGWLGLG